jgi:hypothetical protein
MASESIQHNRDFQGTVREGQILHAWDICDQAIDVKSGNVRQTHRSEMIRTRPVEGRIDDPARSLSKFDRLDVFFGHERPNQTGLRFPDHELVKTNARHLRVLFEMFEEAVGQFAFDNETRHGYPELLELIPTVFPLSRRQAIGDERERLDPFDELEHWDQGVKGGLWISEI